MAILPANVRAEVSAPFEMRTGQIPLAAISGNMATPVAPILERSVLAYAGMEKPRSSNTPFTAITNEELTSPASRILPLVFLAVIVGVALPFVLKKRG
ncbi:MAG: hypothetical protein V4584_15555 [Verrucomicrobiota bacterium]